MLTVTHIADTHLGHRQYGVKQREGDVVSTLRATQDVRNIIARNPSFEEPVNSELAELLAGAETQGAPADEIGEVPQSITSRTF